MKKFIFSLLFVLILLLTAQTDFESWKKSQNKEFGEYISKQDKEFSEFLKKNWEEYQAFKENKLFDKPKIKKAPKFKKTIKKAEKKTVKKTETMKTMPDDKVNVKIPAKPREQKITNDVAQFKPVENKIIYTFWGYPVSISKIEVKLKEKSKIDKNYISHFWYKSSVAKYKDALADLKKYRKKINLNDWGYCLLVHSYAKKIFPNDSDNQNLLDWFFLIKSGYNVKIGFNADRVVILMPSKDTIYGYPYIKQNGKNYYLVDFDNKKSKNVAVFTYDGDYPDADDIMDFSMKNEPNLKKVIIKKEFKFKYNDKFYTINVEFNKNLSEFLKKFPNTDLSVYFNSDMDAVAKYSIAKSFEPILNGKTKQEAVNIILRFMQTAFEYKTDQEQFGYEKVFYPEETLFYPYSDCEDRAILFSYLVRTLLNLQVIGLDYPGHVAAAVNFGKKLSGDIVSYQGRRYLICDPTYINAPIGNAMPKFKTTQPKIIAINKIGG